ncbi:HAMP domain-containing sensor histidine kinase [Prosthecobacter sp.]|uniref:sensor histidine kinase n=1 Tax=Prosthecobacter sp. TaxID=1965333 RepID=UPI002ABB6CC9|nr:HAMP domain-containing sensor histidine kinase [Prosthecobacter sp.]MDZ4404420.1 HAMP domain-containing sensor histidine kinase [Prosthecobacter sp.]
MMSRLKLPLYGKILLWFLVNLAVLALFGYVYVSKLITPELEWLLSGPPGSKFEHLSARLRDQLISKPQNGWLDVLERYEDRRGVTFALFSSDGQLVLGHAPDPPEEVRKSLIDKRRAEPRQRPQRPEASSQPPKPRFLLRSENPTRYWAGIHMDILYEQGDFWHPLTMVMVSSDVSANGLLFNWTPWAILFSCGILFSALLWLPVVRGITEAIRRTNEASRRIAAGKFDVRLSDTRGDELGELATSVNVMAAQLGDYVAQQRRITADVAHELCSPIARMQMALGVVEQRSTPEQETYLKKLDNELQHMAKLVEEVLAFSKAATLPDRETAETFDLRELIDQVIAREAPECEIRVIVEDLNFHTLRSALDRALGNVLRNAVRYARDIEIHACSQNDRVTIQVLDQGPGVPADSLARLFEPFYRPEAARGRNTGGSGLGLAITKRCIDACGGTVTARLREPAGLIVEIVIPNG